MASLNHGALKPNLYELQTQYRVIERFLATKGLEQLSISDTVDRLRTNIELLKAALEASTVIE